MSNAIFPIPAQANGSRGWPIGKYPVFNTLTQTPASRRGETRISTTPYCTWEFSMTFPYVPGTFNDSTSYLNQVAGFFMSMQGSANSFLYDDPQDNTISSPVSFGTGDGSTTAFQLSRPIGNYSDIIQNVNGTPTLYMNGTNITTRNLIPDSDGTSGTWTGDVLLIFSSTGGAVTGGQWTYTGTGSTSSFRAKFSTPINVVPNAQYTLSGYIDASHVTSIAGGGNACFLLEDTTTHTTFAQAAQSIGTNGRVSVTFTMPSTTSQVLVLMDTNNCTVASGQPLVFSNPQLEIGSTATAYQSTNQTGYSISSLGVVTFTTAPAVNAALAWTGKYYFRCRFKNDDLSELKEISKNFWTIGQLEWVSVIL